MLYEDDEREQGADYGCSDAINDTLSDISNKKVKDQFNKAHEQQLDQNNHTNPNTNSLSVPQNNNPNNQPSMGTKGDMQPNTGSAGANVSQGATKGASEAADETAKEGIKEGAKELAEKGSEAAIEATADAATFGIAEVVFTAIRALKATEKTFESVGNRRTAEEDYEFNKIIILVAILFLIFMFPIMGTAILTITPGSSQSYQETEFGGMPNAERAKNNYSFTNNNPDAKIKTKFSNEAPLGESIEQYYKLIDNAIKVAFKDYCIQTINDLSNTFAKVLINPELVLHDSSLSKEYFLDNPYPYCLKKSNTDYYKVGDFLKRYESEVTDYETQQLLAHYTPIPDNDLNNDVNYAEIMSIFGQNPKFAWDNCTLDEYKQFLNSERTQKLFYEMSVDKNEPWYHAKETEMITKEDGTVEEVTKWTADYPRSQVPSAHIPFLRKYYFKVIVKPYGLQELYKMIDIDKDAGHFDYKDIRNYEMTNRNELYIRTFAREKEEKLGPSAFEPRSKLSTIYEDIKKKGTDPEAPGRSLWFYLNPVLNAEKLNEKPPAWFPDEEPPQFGIDYSDTDDTVILDMPTYINQSGSINFKSYGFGSQPRGGSATDTIQKSGCCDCSYMMVASYYHRNVYTANEIVNICKTMVSRQQFQTPTFLSSVGMTNNTSRNFDIEYIRNTIREGKPLIFHIRGTWSYGGRVLHKSSNGHFLVIMGYSPDGFFFYDPGSNSNTQGGAVPYAAFAFVADKYVRAPYLPGFTPHFKSGYEPQETSSEPPSSEDDDSSGDDGGSGSAPEFIKNPDIVIPDLPIIPIYEAE